MMLYRFGCREIEAAGYDAQCELLKIKFVCDGEIWQYYGVPEDIWYKLREETSPDAFFHRFIKGRFKETRIL